MSHAQYWMSKASTTLSLDLCPLPHLNVLGHEMETPRSPYGIHPKIAPISNFSSIFKCEIKTCHLV